MLVWRGYGILVVIFTALAYAGTTIAAEHLWGTPLPSQFRPGIGLAAMVLAAALVYALHLALQRSNQARVVIDKASGQEIRLVAKHDLFFIPIKFWPYILGAVGIMLFFQR